MPDDRASAGEAGPEFEAAASTVPNPPVTGDALDVLMDDHRALEALFVELEEPGTGARRRGDIADVLVAELSRHAAAEEHYFYPVVRDHLPGGDQLAEQEIREHAEVEEVARRLIKLDPTEADFDQVGTELMGRLRHHMREEETKLFPRLREACSPELLVELGRQLEHAEQHGPTLPHPGAPHSGPLSRLTGPVLATLDHVTDALTDRPTHRSDLNRPDPNRNGSTSSGSEHNGRDLEE